MNNCTITVHSLRNWRTPSDKLFREKRSCPDVPDQPIEETIRNGIRSKTKRCHETHMLLFLFISRLQLLLPDHAVHKTRHHRELMHHSPFGVL